MVEDVTVETEKTEREVWREIHVKLHALINRGLWSQLQIGEFLGYSRSTIAKWAAQPIVKPAYSYETALEILERIRRLEAVAETRGTVPGVMRAVSDNVQEEIMSKLHYLRHQKRYFQQQIADHLGVSRRTISNWERGLYRPTSKIPLGEDILAKLIELEQRP